jgi:Protein of unknown function (DUF1574)
MHRLENACRRRRPRPGQSLLWGAAVFGALQALVGVSVAAGWVAVHDLAFSDKSALLAKHQAVFQKSNDPNKPLAILALGSSRTLGGLDAHRLGQILSVEDRPAVAFNFGIPAAGPITINLYLRRLVRAGVRPDFVLIEVLPPFLAGQLPTPMESRWLMPHRLRDEEFALLDRWGFSMPRESVTLWSRWLAGSHLYRYALLSQNLSSWIPYEQLCDVRDCTDSHGWAKTPFDSVSPEEHERGLMTAWKQYRYALGGFRLGGPACAALEDLLAFCRSEQIPAALVLLPESAAFRSWYTPQALQEIDEFIAGLCDSHEVGLIDARTWIPDDSFADGHHLLPAGAERFTERLAAELGALPNYPHSPRVGGPLP